MNLAPIILFVYNRKWHTKETINALKKNHLSSKSELFIYSDGPKNKKDLDKVNEVRQYLETIQGFKKVTIIKKEKNQGLATSIISGVTEIINKYGKVIVLEDDLVTSPYFLNFMNKALDYFEDNEKVWHISGWSIPIDLNNESDVYLYRVMNCWGWATWSKHWKYFEKNTSKLLDQFSTNDIKLFNLDGTYNNFWKQVVLNHKNKLETWAIFWYAVIFKNNGLCLNPCKSFVRNIGFDGSGNHTFDTNYDDNIKLNNKELINFDIEIKEDSLVINQIKNYYKNTNNNFLSVLFDRVKIFWSRK